MSIALLGLVLIQFYWIDNAIALKKDEFNQKIVLVMRHIVHNLEREETIENLHRHHMGRELIHRQIMKRKRHELMQQKRVLQNRNSRINGLSSNAGIEGTWRITEQYSSDSSLRLVTKEFVTSDSNVLVSKLENKSAFIDDIILNLIEVDQFRSIEERVNTKSLDKMIKNELSEFMVHTNFEFGVFDYFGKMITDTNIVEDVSILRDSEYKARLFPNDIFGEPFYLSLHFPNQKSFLLKSMWITLSISTLFLLLIVAAFSYTIHIIQNQKQLSLIKNDFISNMTHELKTPISTISLACEALSDEEISKDDQKKNRFLQMISQENSRLAMLVENVLKSSIWDKSDFKLKLQDVDMHEIITEIAETAEVIVEQKNGKLTMALNANQFHLQGDRVHLTNILHNLLDNAIKYSPEKPRISLSTSNTDKEFLIEVKDNGVGIPKDQQKKIFDKFYRIPTGNIHDVKGFGLGLNYVQIIVRNHGGYISLKSNPDQGSCFRLHIPFNFNG